MGDKRDFFEVKRRRLTVDPIKDPQTHQRVAQLATEERPRRQRGAPVEAQGGVENLVAGLEIFHVHQQLRPRLQEFPGVLLIHGEKGRNVEILRERKSEGLAAAFVRLVAGQHIGMAFAPRCVDDVGHNRLELLTVRRVAVVERNRIEVGAEASEVREQADRPRRPLAQARLDQIAHTIPQWPLRVAQIIGPAVGQKRPPARRT